jgi:tetratricopeptide (TPR) repeat protein
VALALLLCRDAGAALRLLAGYAWLVLLPALYLTQSRSGFLGLAAGVLVVLGVTGWQAGPRRFVVRVLTGLLVLGLGGTLLWLFSPVVQTRVAEALKGDIRQVLWQDTWTMIMSRPWLGFGPGSYRWAFPGFQQHFRAHVDPEFAHNEFLHASAEFGFAGAFLMILPFLVAAGWMLARVRKVQREKDAFLMAGALGVWAGSAVHGFFDYNLQIFANLHVLALVSGVAVSGWSSASRAAASRAWPRGVSYAVALAGLLAVIAASVFTLRSWMSWRLNELGAVRRAELAADAAKAAFEASCAWAPWYAEPLVGLGDLARTRTFWLRDPVEKQAAAAEALDFYAEAERLNPWEPDARFGRSRVLRHLGRTEEALAALADIVTRMPHHAYYLAQWGVALSDAGRYAEALSAFQRSQAAQSSTMAANYIAWLQKRLEVPPVPEAKPDA